MFNERKGQTCGEERPGGVWKAAESLVVQDWMSSEGQGWAEPTGQNCDLCRIKQRVAMEVAFGMNLKLMVMSSDLKK